MLSRMTHLPPQPQPPQQPGIARYGVGLPTPPPKKKNPTWVVVGAIVIAVCCGTAAIIGAINSLGDKRNNNTSSAGNPGTERSAVAESPSIPTTSPTPPPPPPAPAGPATSFTTGTYEVGVDIKAGTYTCTATGIVGGYWERAKNASGEFDAIIANDNIEAGATGIITVKAKEFFKVNRLECVIR